MLAEKKITEGSERKPDSWEDLTRGPFQTRLFRCRALASAHLFVLRPWLRVLRIICTQSKNDFFPVRGLYYTRIKDWRAYPASPLQVFMTG